MGTIDSDKGSLDDSSSSDISGAASTDVARITTQAEFDKVCSSSFRGICAIAFATSDGAEHVQSTLSSVASLAGSAGAVFRYVLVDGTCQSAFAGAFDVQSTNLPAVVAYSVAKGRFASFKGAFQAVSSHSSNPFFLVIFSRNMIIALYFSLYMNIFCLRISYFLRCPVFIRCCCGVERGQGIL